MRLSIIDPTVETFKSLEYREKFNVYQRVFSLGKFQSDNFNDKLILISLIALTTNKMREKDPSITPLKILMQITNQVQDDSAFYQFLEALSLLVDDLMYGVNKFDSCGLTTSQEIINKIKEILNQWLPF